MVYQPKSQFLSFTGTASLKSKKLTQPFPKFIVKRGVLKNVFIGAAECVIQKGNPLKQIYDNARTKGLDHRAAKKNLARRIAAIALAVMKRKSPYQEREKIEI